MWDQIKKLHYFIVVHPFPFQNSTRERQIQQETQQTNKQYIIIHSIPFHKRERDRQTYTHTHTKRKREDGGSGGHGRGAGAQSHGTMGLIS
jgi:hypothetical protein